MISVDGLRILSTLEKVEKLGLESCTGIDDSAAAELVKWKSLKTRQGVDALRKAKPGLIMFANPAS